MNVQEAQRISAENTEKRAEIDRSRAIEQAEEKIKKAAVLGFYKTSLTLNVSDKVWKTAGNTDHVISDLESAGFLVDVAEGEVDEVHIDISWEH